MHREPHCSSNQLGQRSQCNQVLPQITEVRSFAWQTRPEVVRLHFLGFDVLGDEGGPTVVRFSPVCLGAGPVPSDRDQHVKDHDLACLAKWPALRSVNIGGAGRYRGGASIPAAVQETGVPAFSDPGRPRIDARDVEPLEHMGNLRELKLAGRHMSADAMKRVGRLASLESLDISEMPVESEGLAYLSGLKHLKELVLSETKVTGNAIKYLAPLRELRDLALNGTWVRGTDVRGLARSIPRLHIGGDWDVPPAPDNVDRRFSEVLRAMPDVALFPEWRPGGSRQTRARVAFTSRAPPRLRGSP